ncbi:MAG: AraC family transcriptional regulator, partial [Pseudomonadota bacterium]|nr:AraC family transcriptional regulator [Pseudomonadota bacterium]
MREDVCTTSDTWCVSATLCYVVKTDGTQTQRAQRTVGTARLRKPLADLAFEARQLIDDCPERFQSIRALAAELNTNETTLQRQFKAKFDLTVFQYVLARRMQAARILIKDGHLQIAEVAYRVGYNSPANFSTAYRRYYGHAPQDERSKS